MPCPPDLPDFDRPPLVEVVLSTQFSDLQSYRAVHPGLLWERKFRGAFPDFEEQPPLDPIFETFGPKSSVRARLTVQELPGIPAPRLWFLNREKSYLIQVQANRFILNWRLIPNAKYPHYEVLKDQFFQELAKFSDFLRDEKIGKLEPNQCEITYVNIIKSPDGEDIMIQPDRVLRLFAPIATNEANRGARLPRRENVQFVCRYVIEDSIGEPAGRLFITGQPAIGTDQTPFLRLDLTARGAPTSEGLKGVAEFLDLGRDAIVRGFTAITTEEMHQLWGRTQ